MLNLVVFLLSLLEFMNHAVSTNKPVTQYEDENSMILPVYA